MQVIVKLDDWFESCFQDLKCENDTRAYVVNVLASYKSTKNDLSDKSLVLEFSEARSTGRFEKFQILGDWILWDSIVNQKHDLEDLKITIAQLSYHACNRIMKNQWKLYEELARDFSKIATDARCKLHAKHVIF